MGTGCNRRVRTIERRRLGFYRKGIQCHQTDRDRSDDRLEDDSSEPEHGVLPAGGLEVGGLERLTWQRFGD